MESPSEKVVRLVRKKSLIGKAKSFSNKGGLKQDTRKTRGGERLIIEKQNAEQ